MFYGMFMERNLHGLVFQFKVVQRQFVSVNKPYEYILV
jgi:hypothetical protein